VPADATLHDLIEDYFIRYTYGGYPVVDDGRVVGLVTLHELRNTPVEGRAATRVERVMVPLGAGLVVDPRTPVVDALDRMVTGGVLRPAGGSPSAGVAPRLLAPAPGADMSLDRLPARLLELAPGDLLHRGPPDRLPLRALPGGAGRGRRLPLRRRDA